MYVCFQQRAAGLAYTHPNPQPAVGFTPFLNLSHLRLACSLSSVWTGDDPEGWEFKVRRFSMATVKVFH